MGMGIRRATLDGAVREGFSEEVRRASSDEMSQG